jgi:hypothetical protein
MLMHIGKTRIQTVLRNRCALFSMSVKNGKKPTPPMTVVSLKFSLM